MKPILSFLGLMTIASHLHADISSETTRFLLSDTHSFVIKNDTSDNDHQTISQELQASLNAKSIVLTDADYDGLADDMIVDCAKLNDIKLAQFYGCEMDTFLVLQGVEFPHDSADLTDTSKAILQKAVSLIQSKSKIQLEIAGYTDDTGTEDYNLALSNARANSVLKYFVEQGLDADSLTTKGYGESNPVASNKDEAGQQKNRRVTLNIVSQ